ncbi:MAG: hypothetical protein FWG98_13245 [Candidatus Cloacimonetes bacterium]|nr:hypothetical protein [Candidatus Cloacimonadota bacterium]
MKNLVWIDDDISNIELLLPIVFHYLWENECKSKIVFFGDNYRATSPGIEVTQMEIENLKNLISDQFGLFCNKKTYKTGLTPFAVSKKYEHLTPTDIDPSLLKETAHDIIIERIEKSLEGISFIAIDICLFQPDKHLEKETLTMKLFHHLTKKKYDERLDYRVFLYTYPTENYAVEKWKDRYKYFHEESPCEPTIFSTKNLITPKYDNSKELNEFINFLFPKNVGGQNE